MCHQDKGLDSPRFLVLALCTPSQDLSLSAPCHWFPNLFSPVHFFHGLLKFDVARTELIVFSPFPSHSVSSLCYCLCTVPSASFEPRNPHWLPSFSPGPTRHRVPPLLSLRYMLLFTHLHVGHHCYGLDHHHVLPSLPRQTSNSWAFLWSDPPQICPPPRC